MKIAICLPSYNEANNIQNITQIIDKQLTKLHLDKDSIILNIDNSSKDGTSTIFLNTTTKCNKKALNTEGYGKGRNILEFFKFCLRNNVEHAFMFDSDLRKLKRGSIKRMLYKLKNGCDFVIPNYKRTRFEGNVTNHFVYPLIAIKYNKLVRQPIAGDYAFNLNIIKSLPLNEIQEDECLLTYGIDLFLVDTAIKNNFKIGFVEMGNKVHSESFLKTETIFLQVFNTWKHLSSVEYNASLNFRKKNFISINRVKNCPFFFFLKKLIQDFLIQNDIDILNYDKVKKMWLNNLVSALLTEENKIDIVKMFTCFTISYWIKFKNSSRRKCEKELIENIILLNENLRRGNGAI